MKKFLLVLFLLVVVSLAVIQFIPSRSFVVLAQLAPSFMVGEHISFYDSLRLQFSDWERPDVPVRVGIQVGHWKSEELPDELEHIRRRVGGASGGGMHEREVGMIIALEVAKILNGAGVQVDILPATVAPSYWADAFVAIHADGHPDPQVNGFRLSPPELDITEKGEELSDFIEKEYALATQIDIHPFITENMTQYYAFNWLHREYAIHPMTPAVIIETGFLTNPRDQRILIDNPEKSAQGISRGVINFLSRQGLFSR